MPAVLPIGAIISLSIAILILFVVYARSHSKRERKEMRTKLAVIFAGRPALNDQEFYDRYFAKLGVLPEVAIGVR